MSHEIETAAERAFNERAQLSVSNFGDGLPYVKEHYIAANVLDLRMSLEGMFRVGRRLMVMKECEPHGSWLECLQQQGLDDRYARRLMESARRIHALPNRATSPDLVKAIGSQSKMFEVLALSDDQFAELAETGATGSLIRDEIEGMTVRELRNAVREAREKVAKRDETIAETSKHISELRDSISSARRAWVNLSPDQQREKLKVEITKAVTAVEHPISEHNQNGGLHGALCALHEHLVEHGGNEAHWVISQLNELQRQIEMLKLRWSAAV